MKPKEQIIQDIKNKNDEYLNTVYAIIGFLNTYIFELSNSEDKVKIFQGRKLFLDKDKNKYVTPDLGLVHSTSYGLVGEVKYSFPADQSHWEEIFKQLHKYSFIISGWPTETENVSDYDIVLLVHNMRSRKVIDYYINSLKKEYKPKKNFAIVEFTRSSQGKEFFFFRLEYGKIKPDLIHKKLHEGVSVPMEIYVGKYSKVKIYDSEPPISFLLHLIYECMLDKAVAEGTYKKLTKKSKILVSTSVNEITNILREVYSFKSLQSSEYQKGQPESPKIEWTKRAIDKLIEMGEANWEEKTNGTLTYILTAKEGNVLDYYITKTLQSVVQQELFS